MKPLITAIRATVFASRRLSIFQFVIASLMLCLSAPQVLAKKTDLTVLRPARVASFERGVRVAVVPLAAVWQGSWGGESEDVASAAIISALASLEIGGQNYFDVLDRSQVLNIIKSGQTLRQGALVDADTLPDLSSVLGADYVVSGQVRYALDTEWESETFSREVCDQKNEEDECIEFEH